MSYLQLGHICNRPFFLEGKPGRGKTFVVDVICSQLRGQNVIILVVRSSALAATLYEGGRMAHNLFQIPVLEVSPQSPFTVCHGTLNERFVQQDNVGLQSTVRPFSNCAELIKSCGLIAWDEPPAANVTWLDCVDELCRSLKHRDKPFSGIPFISLGDFRQVAPVVKGSGSTPPRLALIKSSRIWTSFLIHTLHTPIQSAQDPRYMTSVNNISEDHRHCSVVRLDFIPCLYDMEDCVSFLFPDPVLMDPLSSCTKKGISQPKECTS